MSRLTQEVPGLALYLGLSDSAAHVLAVCPEQLFLLNEV